jgi:hypothetical protein
MVPLWIDFSDHYFLVYHGCLAEEDVMILDLRLQRQFHLLSPSLDELISEAVPSMLQSSLSSESVQEKEDTKEKDMRAENQ